MKNIKESLSKIMTREVIIIGAIFIIFALACCVEGRAVADGEKVEPMVAYHVEIASVVDTTEVIDTSKHISVLENGAEVIRSEEEYAVAYNSATGKVSFWSFEELQNEYTVPEWAVYEGLSYWEGDIFHKDGDVYSLRGQGSHMPDDSVNVIAHNVQEVLDANYDATQDDFSQPLFLMEDGSKKFYTSYYGKELPTDDVSHLKLPLE